MTPYKKRMNPFIQRMVGDMQLRNLADATIDAFAELGQMLDQARQMFVRANRVLRREVSAQEAREPGYVRIRMIGAQVAPDRHELQVRANMF